MKPFYECQIPDDPPEDKVRKVARAMNLDDATIEKHFRNDLRRIVKLYRNNKYQVAVYDVASVGPDAPKMVWLSIKRIDRKPIHDWRDLQRIKNAIVGPECEGVELYPAESRLADTANQYHLWVIADPTFRFPFGMSGGRAVADPKLAAEVGAVQRSFEEGL